MPGRSSDDRIIERLSVAVSGLLIGGLLLVGVAYLQNSEANKVRPSQLNPPKPAPTAIIKKPLATPLPDMAMIIKLPPPPLNSAPVRSLYEPLVAKQSTIRITTKSTRLTAKVRRPMKRRIVKPLKKSVQQKSSNKFADPLKPSPSVPQVASTKKETPDHVDLIRKRLKTAERYKHTPTNAKKQLPKKIASLLGATKFRLVETKHRKIGGALLRLLEHGKGPDIEIAWPLRLDTRRDLYRHLTHCLGVRSAVLTKNQKLFAMGGKPRQAWSIEMDRYSGFIRSPQGEPIAKEVAHFQAIAQHHALKAWWPVRVFPRDVDAALLSGLGSILGTRYKVAKRIRASYRWDGARLILSSFIVDGKPLDGEVILPSAHGPGCN